MSLTLLGLVCCAANFAGAGVATPTYTPPYTFCDTSGCTSKAPDFAPIQASDGNFYTADGSELYSLTPAGALTVLYTFCQLENCPDGNSTSGLIHGGDAADGACSSTPALSLTLQQ